MINRFAVLFVTVVMFCIVKPVALAIVLVTVIVVAVNFFFSLFSVKSEHLKT